MDSVRLQFLRDTVQTPECKAALQEFFNAQSQYYRNAAAGYLLKIPPDTETALRNAVFALAYESAMAELKHFVENQG